MPAAPALADLFGHVPQAAAKQSELFESAEGDDAYLRAENYVLPYPKAPSGGHTPDTVRAHVAKVMELVRAAEVMPFGPIELRSYNAMLPYMCEWLKGGEGEALLAEYRGKIAALTTAA